LIERVVQTEATSMLDRKKALSRVAGGYGFLFSLYVATLLITYATTKEGSLLFGWRSYPLYKWVYQSVAYLLGVPEYRPGFGAHATFVWCLLAAGLLAVAFVFERIDWARNGFRKATGFITVVGLPLSSPSTRFLLGQHLSLRVEVAAVLVFVGFFAYLGLPKRTIWNVLAVAAHLGFWGWLSYNPFAFGSWGIWLIVFGGLTGLVWGVCVRLPAEATPE
jgi:hypothetical protein